jgi:hypothetical protein
MTRDAVYFIAPRVVRVVEHSPYHDRRPDTWRGPFPTKLAAQRAIVSPSSMKVWAVVIEWQHCASWDEGAAEVFGLYASEESAKKAQQEAIDLYSGADGNADFNYTPYWNPKTEEESEDWDFDVKVEEREVKE